MVIVMQYTTPYEDPLQSVIKTPKHNVHSIVRMKITTAKYTVYFLLYWRRIFIIETRVKHSTSDKVWQIFHTQNIESGHACFDKKWLLVKQINYKHHKVQTNQRIVKRILNRFNTEK